MSLLTNLVSYWKLDESSGNASDSVGSNTLTNNNTATFSSGKINNGVVLNGTNQTMSSSGTFPSGANPVTISFWCKADVTTGNRFPVSYGNDASGQMFGVFTNNTSNFWFTSNAGDDDSGVTFNTTDWYHIVFVDTGTTQIGYVNGVAKTSRTRTLSKGSGNFKIGSYPTSGSYWDGMIDEVAVWSRALDSSEVTELYNSGNGNQYPFSLDVAAPLLTITNTFYAPTLSFIDPVTVSAPLFNITNTFYAPSLQIGIWSTMTKNTVTLTQATKNTTSWTDQTRN